MSYKLLTKAEIDEYLPLIVSEKVSTRARKPDGFLTVYLSGKPINKELYPGKDHSYLKERENFIRRTLPAYVRKPSLRRFLALVAWAFKPDVAI
jgi:hypothetical protein